MYTLFEIVGEYFDAVDNSKEPLSEDLEKKALVVKSAPPRFQRQRASSAIFTTTPEEKKNTQ
jgi:hypothetical protein